MSVNSDLGFFRGLIPRLVGDVIYISISATVVYLAIRQFGKTKLTEQAAGMTGNVSLHNMDFHLRFRSSRINNCYMYCLMQMVAGSFSYPFQVVSNVMIVNNSGLAIGTAPYTRIYEDWYDAYRTLKSQKQLKRGSSLVGRAYTGPTYLVDGKLKPFGFFFGPAHPPGTPYRPSVPSLTEFTDELSKVPTKLY